LQSVVIRGTKQGMSELIKQLQLPTEHSEETLFIKRMKETLAAAPVEKGDRLCMTFKISRDRHGELLAQVAKHGMTVTDILTLHIDQIIPVLEKAKPVDVPGSKKDKRLRISQVLKRQKDTEKAKWSV
jgi:hypothetical protein